MSMMRRMLQEAPSLLRRISARVGRLNRLCGTLSPDIFRSNFDIGSRHNLDGIFHRSSRHDCSNVPRLYDSLTTTIVLPWCDQGAALGLWAGNFTRTRSSTRNDKAGIIFCCFHIYISFSEGIMENVLSALQH